MTFVLEEKLRGGGERNDLLILLPVLNHNVLKEADLTLFQGDKWDLDLPKPVFCTPS